MPDGWRNGVDIAVDDLGVIRDIVDQARQPDASVEVLPGALVPGMANLHSHAFQRGFAGLVERRSGRSEDFWSWRSLMYRFAALLDPETVADVAAQAYLEMVEAGYTSVCEFHYLHHDRNGDAYPSDEMATALIEAAEQVGIALTLLPALYRRNGFDAVAVPSQRRFIDSPEAYLNRLAALDARAASKPNISIGIAFHSLRAVPAEDIAFVLSRVEPDRPVHIHVAEQIAEVNACRDSTGQPPIAWLLAHCPVGAPWALVHATHASVPELTGVARTGATVVLCPSTEGNLADGRFAFAAYCAHRGRFGIGSDSHVTINPCEELRWLDYQNRIETGKRVPDRTGTAHRGADLWLSAAGSPASGQVAGTIAVGQRADWLVLDGEAAALAGRSGDGILDTFVFGARPGLIRDVIIGGRRVVRDGRHQHVRAIQQRYARTIARLVQEMERS